MNSVLARADTEQKPKSIMIYNQMNTELMSHRQQQV